MTEDRVRVQFAGAADAAAGCWEQRQAVRPTQWATAAQRRLRQFWWRQRCFFSYPLQLAHWEPIQPWAVMVILYLVRQS